MADEIDPITELLSQLRCDDNPKPPAVAAEEPPAIAAEEPPVADILDCSYWSNGVAFKCIKDKLTQASYYRMMGASNEVVQLVLLESKPFGSVMENIVRETFGMDDRTSSENDGLFQGIKIEIKSARYWGGKDDCRWQHLEEKHDYDVAMFVLLDFHRIKVWCIKKSLLMGEELREKKIVMKQGKQGSWVTMKAIMPYLVPIQTKQDMIDFIKMMEQDAH